MRIRKGWWLLGALTAATVVACGDDDDGGAPPPATARYFVTMEGTVEDAFGAPIAGAQVTLSSSLLTDEEARTVTTEEDGRYRFRVEALGDFALEVEAEGYARSRTSFSVTDVPDTTGVFEGSEVRDVVLYELTASLRGRITQSRGTTPPLADAPLTLRLDETSIRDPAISNTVTTDADGAFELTGLPSGTRVTLFVPAVDVDEDGEPDTEATTRSVNLGFATTEFVRIEVGEFDGPRAVWSNAQDLLLGADADLQVFYSVPMDRRPVRTSATLRLTSPTNTEVFSSFSWSSDGRILTVDPGAPLTPGGEYQLSVIARSAESGAAVGSSYQFTVEGGEETTAPGNLALQDDDFEVIATTSSFDIAFDAVDGASSYTVYARETVGAATDWREVTSFFDSTRPRVERTISLPTAFRADGTNTFLDGELIELAVSATVGGVESALSDPLALQDDTCPEAATPVFTTSWDNSLGGFAQTSSAIVSFTESMDQSAAPAVTISGSVLDSDEVEVEWLNATQARISVTIPEGVDASGLDVSIALGDVEDLNGNAVCEDATPIELTSP